MEQADHTHTPNRSDRPGQSTVYEIRVQGQLDTHWSDWFNGLEVAPQENGETLITGPLPDQAALFDMLLKVFNLKLTLLSVRRVESK